MIAFERPGPCNTDSVIATASVERHSRIRHVVVASVTGASAVKAAHAIRDKNIVCVTCPQGMHWEVAHMRAGPFAEIPELAAIRDRWVEQGFQRVPMSIDAPTRRALEDHGVTIVRGTIPFFGPSFSMRLHVNHTNSLDIVAKTLELISPGTLVCLESVLMAVDAGAVPEGEEVIALAGTERGLDTAWTIRSASSGSLFAPEKGARFIELLAKPRISTLPEVAIPYLR